MDSGKCIMENSNVHFQKAGFKTVGYIAKFALSGLFCVLLMVNARAQRGFAITFGLPYGIYTGDAASTLKPGTGIQMGLDFWAKNRKGHDWIAGVAYQSLKQKGEVTFNGRKSSSMKNMNTYRCASCPCSGGWTERKNFMRSLAFLCTIWRNRKRRLARSSSTYRSQTKAYYTGPCVGIGYKLEKKATATACTSASGMNLVRCLSERGILRPDLRD